MKRLFQEIGSIFLFFISIQRAWVKRLNQDRTQALSLAWDQTQVTFLRSFFVVALAGFFMGGVFVLQFQLMLAKFNGHILLGGLNTSAIFREVGPLIISFVLAAKVGAYTAAELGTMQITLQIDAARALGTDPIGFLIAPRFYAMVFCSFVLLFIGVFFGLVGSICFASVFFKMTVLQYFQSVPKFLSWWSTFGAFFKSTVYSSIVATVCTHRGFTAEGGAKGIGTAVTETALYTNLLILLATFFTTAFLELIAHLIWGPLA